MKLELESIFVKELQFQVPNELFVEFSNQQKNFGQPNCFFSPQKNNASANKKACFFVGPTPNSNTHRNRPAIKKSHISTKTCRVKKKSQRPIHIRIRHGASFLTPQRMHNDHRFTLDKVLVWQGISVLESQTTSGDRSRLKNF